MPDRFIRESALTSESLSRLSDFAERLFWRLTTIADDFGRFNANPAVVAGRTMPLVAAATSKKVEAALCELHANKSIQLYEIDGAKFAFFPSWSKHQLTRAQKSKFPDPPESADICLQTKTDDSHSDKVCAAPNTNTHTDTNALKGESEGDWSDSPWLLKFLKEQTTFIGDRLPRLLNHDYWADVSEVVNGLTQEFVSREFAKMGVWLRDNPARAPTAKGVRRFVSGWLERAYEKQRRFGVVAKTNQIAR